MHRSRSALLAFLPLLALAACGQAEKDAGKIENDAAAAEAKDVNAVDALGNDVDKMGATDKAQFQSTDATIDNGLAKADADAKKAAGDIDKDAKKAIKAVEKDVR